ncbi:MAG TPA: hypothetical protein VMP01_11335 [Pirellulaceae bacterium]|nr:hypothetical protein [Pirellulaceae bacterium]
MKPDPFSSPSQTMIVPHPSRFSLRLLLGAVVLIAMPLAWYGNMRRALAVRRSAIEKVESLGGFVSYCDDHTLGRQSRRELWGEVLFSDERAFIAVEGIVFIEPTTVSDDSLSVLSQFPYLKQLQIDAPAVTERALVQLRHVRRLEGLYIPSISLTDGGATDITKLRRLKHLVINQSTPKEVQDKLRTLLPMTCEIGTLQRE